VKTTAGQKSEYIIRRVSTSRYSKLNEKARGDSLDESEFFEGRMKSAKIIRA